MLVKQCPQKEIIPDIGWAMQLARFAKQGAWPVGGGTLDQTASFLAACRIVWQADEVVEIENKLKHG